MFTGIITDVSKVAVVRTVRGNLSVAIARPARWKVKAGESVSVSGICSTVAKVGRGVMHFEYMPETLRKTTVRLWRVGERVNLERSLKVGEPLDGHLVMGHVDGVGFISSIEKTRGSRVFRIVPPRDLLRYIVIKGSVAIDGVSLTVVDACPPRAARLRRVGRSFFTVALIPYTLSYTTLRDRRVADRVNIETDILAKYVKRQLESPGYSNVLENIRIKTKKGKK